MSVTLKPGTRLFGTACDTQLIVVKAPGDAVDLQIGGHAALTDAAGKDASASLVSGHDGGTLMGKRYVDEAGTLELLCTKAGAGSIAVGGVVCAVKDAKPLPSSD